MAQRKRAALATELRPRLARIAQAVRRENASMGFSTAQTSVLNILLLGQPLRISDLARAEAVTLPTMTQVINRMVAAGWVARVRPGQTGHMLVDITDAGRQVAAQIAKSRNETLERRLSRLTSEECNRISEVIELLDKMFEQDPWRRQT